MNYVSGSESGSIVPRELPSRLSVSYDVTKRLQVAQSSSASKSNRTHTYLTIFNICLVAN